MSRNTDVQSYFDKHAARYNELLSTIDFQINDAYIYLTDYVSTFFRSQNELNILELGAGTGKLTGFLLDANPTARLTALDISSHMLNEAKLALDRHSQNISYVCGEFPDAIPLKTYDLVVSSIALSFYSIDHYSLFRRIHQSLKRGGLLVYAVNVAQNASVVDATLSGVLSKKIAATKEQLEWLKSIQGELSLYHVPVDWHCSQLRLGGFTDIDLIYLRHKLAIFSASKPKIAV